MKTNVSRSLVTALVALGCSKQTAHLLPTASVPAAAHGAPQSSSGGSTSASVPPASPLPPSRPSVVRLGVETSHRVPLEAQFVIRNSYLVPQFVFIDDQPAGSIPQSSEREFTVAPGAHSIRVADSANGASNTAFIAEPMDAGMIYRYEVVAR